VNWIQRVSRGLVQVSDSPEIETADTDSDAAEPGSMLSNTGESRTVTVIHTSVHDFFRKSSTFGRLLGAPNRPNLNRLPKCIREMKRKREEKIEIEREGEKIEEWRPEIIEAEGHATIIQSCLDYLNLELDHFKKRRQILPSAADDSVRDGIYRNRQIPFSFSAAGSRRSSDDGSGGLALGAVRTDPGEIQGLECIQTKGQLQEDPVMNWLSGTE
jgi:hypothetical protein